MLPLYDEKAPALKLPYVTFSIIGINILIFAFCYFTSNVEKATVNFGEIPSQFLAGQWWAIITLFSHMFLHGSWLHLIGNMWIFWIFGDNVEYNLGKVKFLIFYLLSGIIAGLSYILLADAFGQNLPLVGASGAISGVMGGYLILFPKNKIRCFFLLLFYPLFFNVPAVIWMGIWFLGQLLYIGTISSIAYWAHIGGFLGGILLIILLRQKINRTDYVALKHDVIEVNYEDQKKWQT